MKFNIAYTGPEHLFHLRRDFILVLKYALEDLGHDVALSGMQLDATRFNLIVGAYFLKNDVLQKIDNSGIGYAHVNTEVIAQDMLNFNPKKTDFLGGYLPTMKRGAFVWDVIMDNMAEHARYGTNAHFLRWGFHPRMEDIEHRREKDLDFYFFGGMSERRLRIIAKLTAAGLVGTADSSCPYFLRNDRIARARIQLNLIQDDRYTHVNSFRICYLANNRACMLSEKENDPANYLQYVDVVTLDDLQDRMRYYLADNRWKERGQRAYDEFRQYDMRELMGELLEKSFAGAPSAEAPRVVP